MKCRVVPHWRTPDPKRVCQCWEEASSPIFGPGLEPLESTGIVGIPKTIPATLSPHVTLAVLLLYR